MNITKVSLFGVILLSSLVACQAPLKQGPDYRLSSEEQRQIIIDEWQHAADQSSSPKDYAQAKERGAAQENGPKKDALDNTHKHEEAKSDVAIKDKLLADAKEKSLQVKKTESKEKSLRVTKVEKDTLLLKSDYRSKGAAVADELERAVAGTRLSLRFEYGTNPLIPVRYYLKNVNTLEAIETIAESAGYGTSLIGTTVYITPRITRTYRLPIVDNGETTVTSALATSGDSGAVSDTNIKTNVVIAPYKRIAAGLRARMGVPSIASQAASGGQDGAVTQDSSVTSTSVSSTTSMTGVNVPDADVRMQSNVTIDELARIATVTGTREQINRAEEYLSSIWEEYSYTVFADVKIYEVSLRDNLHQGINWNEVFSLFSRAATGLNIAGAVDIKLPANVPANAGSVGLGVNINKNGAKVGSAIVQLLNQYGDVELTNQPRVHTTNHIPTRIANQDVIRYVRNILPAVAQAGGVLGNGGTETDIITTGTSVLFTPHVVSSDLIQAEIVPIITVLRSIDQNNTGQGTVQLPQTSLRNLKTTIPIHNGEEKALGGLITYRYGEEGSKVPVLGDLPFLGNLFKSSTKWKERVEVLITVKPTIERIEYDDFRINSKSLLKKYLSRHGRRTSTTI